MLCAENVSENEKSGKAEYSYFVPALWHLLLSPPPTPIAHLVLSTADLTFFAPHPVRIFRRTPMDALRRGRRPRRPVFRSPIAGCTRVLHVCLRRPYFFQQRKKYGKERRQKPSVFGFPFRPIVTAVQKGSAPDRLHSYLRCRSCVRRENFLLSRRTGEVLYILHAFIFCGPKGRTYAAVGKSGSLRRAKYPRARARGTLSAGGPQARPPSLLVIPLAADKIHIVPPVCPTRCPIGREPRHFTASRLE